jgi:hypothetical protein
MRLNGVAAVGRAAVGGLGLQIKQGLAGEFTNIRIGVEEQPDERMKPGEFRRVHADHCYIFCHH